MSAKWLTVQNKADDSPAEILITGQIGKSWWDDSGTSESEFLDALKEIPANKALVVGINSEGGSVKDGLGIYNALRRRANVTTRIDGYAVSIASVIALAGDKRISPKSSIWMIHEPWAMAQGNAEDMLRAAEMLESHGQVIADIYAERTGKMNVEAAREKMKAETWFKGDEAVSMGFATEQTDSVVALNALDPLRFKNIPQDILNNLVAASKGGNPIATAKSGCSPVTEAATSISPALEVGAAQTEPPESVATTNQGDNMADTNTAAPTQTADPNAAVLDKLNALEIEIKALRNPPVATPRPQIEAVENVAQAAINKHPVGKSRFEFLRDNWNELAKHANTVPVYNANTTDAALTTAMLASGLIVVLQNRLAPLTAFTRDFGIDRIKPKAIVQVPIAEAGGTAQSNATSFEDTTNFVGSINNVAITANRLTAGAHITPAELNSGFRMAQFVEIKAHELADKIQAAVNAIIDSANFTTTAITAAAAAFNKTDLDDMWEQVAKSYVKNVMLHQSYYKKFLPATLESFNPLASNTLPGWDGVFLNTYWTGAAANTYGFACNPQAIAVASGLPLASPNRGMNTIAEVVALPGIGISVEQQQWYSTSTKTDWANWEIMFGAALGDPAAGVVLKSA